MQNKLNIWLYNFITLYVLIKILRVALSSYTINSRIRNNTLFRKKEKKKKVTKLPKIFQLN